MPVFAVIATALMSSPCATATMRLRRRMILLRRRSLRMRLLLWLRMVLHMRIFHTLRLWLCHRTVLDARSFHARLRLRTILSAGLRLP